MTLRAGFQGPVLDHGSSDLGRGGSPGAGLGRKQQGGRPSKRVRSSCCVFLAGDLKGHGLPAPQCEHSPSGNCDHHAPKRLPTRQARPQSSGGHKAVPLSGLWEIRKALQPRLHIPGFHIMDSINLGWKTLGKPCQLLSASRLFSATPFHHVSAWSQKQWSQPTMEHCTCERRGAFV
jgi:hypothetical protein